MAQQRVNLSVVDVRVRVTRSQRAAFKNNNLRLRKAGPAQLGSQLADKGCPSDPVRVTEQVIGGKQRMGLAATEFGLEPVHTSRGHVTREAGSQFPQEGQQVLGQISLLAERHRIQVVSRAPVAIYQAKVRSEQ